MSQPATQYQQLYHNAWLWGQGDLADVTLHVRPCRDGLAASTSLHSSQPTSQAQPSATSLSLHSVVLAGASPGYFRHKLLELRAQKVRQAADQAQEAMQAASQPPQDSVRVSLRVVAATETDEPWQISGRLSTTANPPLLLAALAGLHQQAPQTDRGSMSRQTVQAAEPAAPPTDTTPDTAPPTPAYTPRATKTLHLTLHPGEPHSVPEAVLCHVYTGTLPDDPEQLIWMLWRADHLDLAATVKACVNKLQSLADSKKMTMQHAAQLHRLTERDLRCCESSGAQAVQQLLECVLQGAMEALATDTRLYVTAILHGHLHQFTQLPLPLLKQWVGLKSVKIDSGNTLAVLFTAWYDAQPTSPTEEQCQELSALLPLSSLTLCYHLQVLSHLKWWRPPANPSLPSHTGLAYALTLLCPEVKKYQPSWDQALTASKLSLYEFKAWHVTLNAAKIRQVWQGTYNTGWFLAMGYKWQAYLATQESGDGEGRVIDCRCQQLLPDPLVQHGVGKHTARLAGNMTIQVRLTFSAVPPATQPCVVTKAMVPKWETSEWVCRDAGDKVFKVLDELLPNSACTIKRELIFQRG